MVTESEVVKPEPAGRHVTEVVFEISEAELIEARRLAFPEPLRNKRLRLFLIGCAAVLLILGFLQDGLSGFPPWLAFLVFFGVMFPYVMLNWYIPWQSRQDFKTDGRFKHPWRIATSENYFFIATAQGETRYFWSALRSRISEKNMTLLMINTRVFIPIPTRVLSAADLATIDDCINRSRRN